MNVRQRKSPVTAVLLAILALLLVAAVVIGLMQAYVGYHQWQADRAMNDFFANGQPAGSIERADYHLHRLIAVGTLDEFQYEFKYVDSASPKATMVVQKAGSGKSPARELLESPAGQVGKKLRISVVCRPEDVDDWEAFVKAHDTPSTP